jgi:hypothetical protein
MPDQVQPAAPESQPALTPAPSQFIAPEPRFTGFVGGDFTGQNAETTAGFTIAKSKSLKPFLAIMIPVTLIVVIGGTLYFWWLPTHRANAYVSKLTTSYESQKSKMDAAYAAFTLPTFSNNNTTTQQDMAAFAQSNAAIGVANAATATLQSANHAGTLPGTTWYGAGKRASKQAADMTNYANDSKTFLTDFQQLVTYASGLDQIQTAQSSGVTSALAAVEQAKTTQAVLTTSQQAKTTLNKMISSIGALNPPSDLRTFHNTTLGNLNSVSDALDGLISSIQNQDAQAFGQSAVQFQQALLKVKNYNPSIGDILQSNSSAVHKLVVKLQAEKPPLSF